MTRMGLQTCGFNILTGERACFGERTGMGWTPTVAWTPLPPAGFIALMPTGASCTPSYSVRASVRQAWSLVYEWFFEQGPSVRVLGPQDPLTRDIMHDPGVQAFRAAWAAAGYPVPWAWSHRADEREGGWTPLRMARGLLVYGREHLVELPLSTGLGLLAPEPEGLLGRVLWGLGVDLEYLLRDPRSPIDPVGGIIGSLDTIRVREAEQEGWVRIEVINVMDWRSGTRIPGTEFSLVDLFVPNEVELTRDWTPSWAPGLPVPGGAITQIFYWEEPRP